MKRFLLFYSVFFSLFVSAQIDYSNSWEDFYSYNNVKDFTKVGDVIYALADNAIFTYDEVTQEIQKVSSIQGLSGETTSSIYYNSTFKRVVIGYENGLVEVIDENGAITISSDIVNFNQSGEKSINHISEFGNTLYLSTPFAIVEYDIENLEFGDTFFIGNQSTSLTINKTIVADNRIYAATEDGIFNADVNSNLLIDFNSWQQQFQGRNFTNIDTFNDQIFVSDNNNLFQLGLTNLSLVRNFGNRIVNLKSSGTNLTVAIEKVAFVLNDALNVISQFITNPEYDFSLQGAFFENNRIYLATQESGILTTTSTEFNTYQEIHPDGPLFNDVFSIAVKNEDLWVVYGGYSIVYGPSNIRKGFSHFDGKKWVNTKFDENFPYTDLNYISIDPNADNRVFISSFGATNNTNGFDTGGLLEVVNDEVVNFYNHLNSPLEDILPLDPNIITIRISGTAFDNEGNLWVTNIGGTEELKRLSPSGQWTSFNISAAKISPALGFSELVFDRRNNPWFGTRGNGVLAYRRVTNQVNALVTTPNLGNLPEINVKTVAIDRNNRVWLGTRSGMSVFDNAESIFESNVLNAQPVIIEENGVGERLLGDQNINSIVVDGANNKWFGTDNGGALYTNPSGRTTIANFSKENSPLPSNRILKIRVDENSGKVYFATDKGIVAYNSQVAPFGEELGEVYAYPNPALGNHETVTIDGRNGTNLPRGTNVKILDIAGNLVYETNVVEGQELQGGKVVWNKKNLAGRKVSSGIYIVLLSSEDASETATTKIAIVN